MALRLCLCGQPVAAGSSRCATHRLERVRAREARRPSPTARGYGAGWREARNAQLEREPNCAVCGNPATQADHRLPAADGGTSDPDNLQSLCTVCHARKTAAQRRARTGTPFCRASALTHTRIRPSRERYVRAG